MTTLKSPPNGEAVRRFRPPAPLGGRGSIPKGLRRWLTAMVFLFPAAVVLLVFVAWPMLSALRLSFTDASGFGKEKWVGFRNYTDIFTNPAILKSVGNTALYAVLFTPTAIVLSLALAMMLHSPRLPLRGFFRTALFLPFVIALAVGAFAWQYLLDPEVGLLNYWLQGLGIQLGNVLQDPHLAMPAVVLVAVWKTFGFYMIIFLAGLQDIPASLYEAAKVDGANAWYRFRNITLPMLSNTMAFVLIFALIAALQAFDQIYVMTGGGPYQSTQTIVMQIYQTGFKKLELGPASALSYVLLLATLILSLGQFTFFGRKEKDFG